MLFFVSGSVFSQVLSWAGELSSSSYFKEGHGVTHDDSGNVYYTGYFSNTVDFDPGVGVYNLTAVGFADAFILKLDSSGHFVWAKSVACTSTGVAGNTCQAFSIAIDKTGNVVVGGFFYGTVDLDPGPGTYLLSSTVYTTSSGFLLKLDPAGNFIWAKQIYGQDAAVYSVHVDDHNNILSTGHFNDTTDFDPGTGVYNLIATGGGEEIFVLKLDASGNFIWAKRMGGNYDDFGYGIATDHAGNVFTTGSFKDVADFDPGSGTYNLVTSYFYSQTFVSKLDSSGNFVWARQMGSHSDDDAGNGIAVDNAGNVYTTGFFYGTADFDPGSGIYNLAGNASVKSMFISRLDNSGNFVWAKQFSDSLGECYGQAIAVDSFSNVYTTGGFADSIDFDPGPSTYFLRSDSFFTPNVFISKLDQSGNFGWAIGVGSQEFDLGYAVSCNNSGAVYVTGVISDSADFDPSAGVYMVDTEAYLSQIFCAKYQYCPAPVPAVTITAHPGLTITTGQSDTLTAALTGGSGPTTWQWYVNGVAVPGAVTSVYITDSLSNNDTVKCLVSTSSLCTTESGSAGNYVVVHVVSAVSAPQGGIASIELWPNPGSFHISGTLPAGTTSAVINIFDALGRQIYTSSQPVRNGSMNTVIQLAPGLPNGVYLLEIRSEASRNYSRFQLQRF